MSTTDRKSIPLGNGTWIDRADVPFGFCHCGCGTKTALASRTRSTEGIIKGQPLRFRVGHGNSRGKSPGTPSPRRNARKSTIRHGTTNGYMTRGCRCEECRRAVRDASRVARQARRDRRTEVGGRMVATYLDASLHGRASTYTNYACRCAPCTDAQAERARQGRSA